MSWEGGDELGFLDAIVRRPFTMLNGRESLDEVVLVLVESKLDVVLVLVPRTSKLRMVVGSMMSDDERLK